MLVTVGSTDEGERIAGAVVGEGLAACVNVVGPIRSMYTWAGTLQRDEEYLLIIKTREERFDALAARVGALHSYETPEILALPVAAGAAAYLEWIAAATAPHSA